MFLRLVALVPVNYPIVVAPLLEIVKTDLTKKLGD
jgi:hypothetical protein